MASIDSKDNLIISERQSNCYARPFDYDATEPTPDEPCGPFLTLVKNKDKLAFTVDGRTTGSSNAWKNYDY